MQKLAYFKQSYALISFSFLLIALAVCLQYQMGFHADNLYLIHAAEQLLSGRTYVDGFFETTPPLIILLNVPVVMLMKYAAFSEIDAFRLYVTCLGLLSIGISYPLMRKIFADNSLFCLQLLGLVVMIFFLPVVSLGQREHLLVMFSFPYIWLSVLRLEGKTVPNYVAVMIGIMAGIGVCIKPYFVVLPVVIESYFMIQHKDIFAWVRAEICGSACWTSRRALSPTYGQAGMLAVLMGYLCVVFLFFPDYVYIVVPMLKKYYWFDSWSEILINESSAYVFIVLACTIFLYKKNPYPQVAKILALATVSFFVTYLLSRRQMFYHQLPMLSTAILLGLLLSWQVAMELFKGLKSLTVMTSQLLMWLSMMIVMYFVAPLWELSNNSIYYMLLRLAPAMIAFVSVALLYRKLRQVFREEMICCLVAIAFILSLFFSASVFGQKEQFIVMLTFPYIFDVISRLQRQTDTTIYALLCGSMLGVAFVVDCHLAVLALILESFVILQNRKMTWEMQSIIVVAVGVFVVLSLGFPQAILHDLGVNIAGIKEEYLKMFILFHAEGEVQSALTKEYYCLLFVVFSLVHFRLTRYRVVNSVLLVCLLGFFLLSLSWKSTSHFAFIPALCSANLLAVFILGEVFVTSRGNTGRVAKFLFAEKIIIFVLACSVLFVLPLMMDVTGMYTAIYQKSSERSSALDVFFDKHPNSTYDFFAKDDTAVGYDVYKSAHFVGQFPLIWWYDYMDKLSKQPGGGVADQMRWDEKLLVSLISRSLVINKPQFVLVKMGLVDNCGLSWGGQAGDKQLKLVNCKPYKSSDNLIKMFSQYPEFRFEWARYKYLETVKGYDIYQRI